MMTTTMMIRVRQPQPPRTHGKALFFAGAPGAGGGATGGGGGVGDGGIAGSGDAGGEVNGGGGGGGGFGDEGLGGMVMGENLLLGERNCLPQEGRARGASVHGEGAAERRRPGGVAPASPRGGVGE